MTDTGKIIIAGAAGVAAGVIAGILLAPASGEETRTKLSETSDDALASLNENFDKLSGDISSLLEQGKAALEKTQHIATEKANNVAEDITEVATKTVQQTKHAMNGAASHVS